jgi:hypothetical protein
MFCCESPTATIRKKFRFLCKNVPTAQGLLDSAAAVEDGGSTLVQNILKTIQPFLTKYGVKKII